jgi:hypothetical protein
LVFAADLHPLPNETWVEVLIFGVIPAFVVLVLLSMIVTGFRAYWPQTETESSGVSDVRRDSINHNDARTRRGKLARLAAGGLIASILMVIAARIYSSMCTAGSMITKFSGIPILALLLIVTALHHRFVNRYMDFPFFSIALRIGLFGVIASLTFTWFLFNFPLIYAYWDKLVHVAGSGIPMLACLLGLTLWWPLNLLFPYQAANTRLHEANGTTALDRLLYQASLAQHLLSISMKDGKVYIGYIQELPPNPEERNSYFEILPVHSGYRDKDTREMKLTTFYETVYERLVESDADEEEWLVFLKVLKIDDILSAGRFDPEVYVRFRGEEYEHAEHQGWDDASG